MRIWVVQIGEMIAGVDSAVRNYRYTTLAEEFATKSHDVLRWSSTFEHISKTFRRTESTTIDLKPNLRVRLLHGLPGYAKNVSVARFLQQRNIAKMFLEEAKLCPKPNLIVAGVPVPELADSAVQYGKACGIPVVVDVQDQWPDIYLTPYPRVIRPLLKILLNSEFRRSKKIFHGATAITAVSESYLNWAMDRGGRQRGKFDGIFPLGFKQIRKKDIQATNRKEVFRKYAIPEDAFLAVFVGTFGSSYDIETIVRCALVIDSCTKPKIHILLAGDGEKMVKAQKISNGCKSITFAGWLGHADVQRILSVSSVGLCAYAGSALQSIPYKPLEYMAAGLPLVSSLAGEMKKIISENECGTYYRSGDAKTLAESLIAMSKSPRDVLEMGQRARKVYENQFDSEKIYPAFAEKLLTTCTSK